ncbi:GspE/PulE family protein [Kaarinaea lacus]
MKSVASIMALVQRTNLNYDNPAALQPKKNFGLPLAPKSLGQELSLLNSPVVAHRMHGDLVLGRLHDFNAEEGKIAVDTVAGESLVIPFVNLRFLIFSRQIVSAEELNLKYENTVATPPQGKSIEIIFRDDKKFYAHAETVITEPSGLHIFMRKADGFIYRVFTPKNTIKHYAAGQHIEAAHDHNEINFAHPSGNNEFAANNEDPFLPVTNNSLEVSMALQNKTVLPQQSFGQLLCARKLLSEAQLQQVLEEQKHRPGVHLGSLLIENGEVPEDAVQSTLAYKLGLPFVKLDSFDIDPTALGYLPRELAVKYQLIPLFLHDGHLVVAIANPTDTDVISMAEFVAHLNIEITVACATDILKAIDKHYGDRDGDEVYETLETVEEIAEQSEQSLFKEAEQLSKERPIVRMVHNMLVEAVRSKASDIHLRPAEKHVDLLFRIDGSLVTVRRYSKAIHAAVVSRIKIIGRMDISERRVPQDGRALILVNHNKVDLRLSVMPTVNGESVVIRLLDTMVGLRNLDQLGFDERNQNALAGMLSKSYGILLVTGPTGSGKSTTLYAAIEHIRKTNVNIITAEDPVEYHIDGIQQMQVNHKVGYTFARILRNILRHDPDVIMVGEIRDQETAKIAIESALTGHLVLSTLHTNSAAVTVTRLLEMGVEPYLINDTLLGVLAQRLVRVNCPHCLQQEKVEATVYEALGLNDEEVFYKGKGCEQCRGTGYHGRMAVYELLVMNPALRQLLSKRVGADDIEQAARSEGMTPLTQNALEAARQKKTSLAEVYRVRLS